MMNDVEHLFTYLTILMYFLGKVFVQFFCPFILSIFKLETFCYLIV